MRFNLHQDRGDFTAAVSWRWRASKMRGAFPSLHFRCIPPPFPLAQAWSVSASPLRFRRRRRGVGPGYLPVGGWAGLRGPPVAGPRRLGRDPARRLRILRR
jgi:hypothetical protein